jgi:two-component system chemotaxis response regulator CheY
MLSEKILVVDDERPISDLMLELLRVSGYSNLERADNGLEGLEKYKSFHPDLVFMDMKMPVMDGYDSCRKIKSFDPSARILVLTGNPWDSRSRRSVTEGYALTLLQKPIRLTDLTRVVRDNLSGGPSEA